jgi:indoleamine 2,3-dioxygenase
MTIQTPGLARYDISETRGFLPSHDPLRRLPSEFDAWEEAALHLPKLLFTDRIRELLEGLPPFPMDRLESEPEVRRAMQCLSYLGHAYVWGEAEPPASLPAVLAVPWYEVAARLGRPPVLSNASYALDKWYRIDPEGPIECGNIALIQNFLGGIDEEWFILIHVEIEACAASGLSAVETILQSLRDADTADLLKGLEKLAGSLKSMHRVLERMPEHCDPYVYYHRVRPYIHGWKNNPATPNGLVYEGVEAYGGQGQHFRGETGAQSAIIPVMDALLGVYHEQDVLKDYLMEMRTYMPPQHRRFIELVEEESTLRERLSSSGDQALRGLYDECVETVERFRSLHLEYAARYIFKQHQTDPSNPTQVGTGGTPFMKYLKKHRDETAGHRLE